MMKKKNVGIVFIVGALITCCGTIFSETEVLFSPEDSPTKRLLEELSSTKNKIYAAVYAITDKRISTKLIEAKKRGVDVQIVTDNGMAHSSFSKIKVLQSEGIPVWIFPKPLAPKPRVETKQPEGVNNGKPQLTSSEMNWAKYHEPIMHHKFALLDSKIWSGSFNWTVSAGRKNREDITFTDKQKVYERYEERFKKLKSDGYMFKVEPQVFVKKEPEKKQTTEEKPTVETPENKLEASVESSKPTTTDVQATPKSVAA
ncbi:hypothetical protein HOD08_00500 [bacterium]|nr:hypothetical protein [bacterium]